MVDLEISQEIKDKHEEFILGKNKTNNDRLYKKFESAISSVDNKKVQEILKFIKDNFKIIVLGSIYELDKIRKKFDLLLAELPIGESEELSKERKELYDSLEIFKKEYKYFYTSPNWNAYELQRKLGVMICSYCNTQFTFVYESKTGKTRGNFDHFFDKATYPFLAISLYNLVPCCKVCNSDFKGSKETTLETHYSPFEGDISKHIRFSKEIYAFNSEEVLSTIGKDSMENIDFVSVILGYKDDFNIKLNIIDASKRIEKKIRGNNTLFHIEKIYNAYHKQYVQDIIQKSYIYNYAYRHQLSNTYRIFFNSPQELKDSLIPTIQADKKTLLGKLTREIIEEETKNFMI